MGGRLKLLLAALLAASSWAIDARWYEADIAAFEAADAKAPPPKGGVVFIGSSSIRMWATLADDMKPRGVVALNRGFGGSHVSHCAAVVDRVVTPYDPSAVVLYAGDNDLADGVSPEQILSDVEAFVRNAHAKKPGLPVLFVSIKPSPARWALVEQMRKANALVRAYASRAPGVDFVDVFTPMLGTNGKPRRDLYQDDGLHMTPAGYALWTSIIGSRLDPRPAVSNIQR